MLRFRFYIYPQPWSGERVWLKARTLPLLLSFVSIQLPLFPGIVRGLDILHFSARPRGAEVRRNGKARTGRSWLE